MYSQMPRPILPKPKLSGEEKGCMAFFGIWFLICAVLGIGLTALIVWLIIEVIQYLGRH